MGELLLTGEDVAPGLSKAAAVHFLHELDGPGLC